MTHSPRRGSLEGGGFGGQAPKDWLGDKGTRRAPQAALRSGFRGPFKQDQRRHTRVSVTGSAASALCKRTGQGRPSPQPLGAPGQAQAPGGTCDAQ